MNEIIGDCVEEMGAFEKVGVHRVQPIIAPVVVLEVAIVAAGHQARRVARLKVLVLPGINDAQWDGERSSEILGRGERQGEYYPRFVLNVPWQA